MRAAALLLPLVLLGALGALGAPNATDAADGPKARVAAVLAHARDNAEAEQAEHNRAFQGLKGECARLVEQLMGEVRPVQRELLSTATLLRERRRRVRANAQAARVLQAALGELAGRVETLGLRMAEAARERRETHHLAAQKVEDTRRLIASVHALMSSVSNAHVRLNASAAALLETGARAGAPTPVPEQQQQGGAAGRTPVQTVEGSFQLLNLLRHELSDYAVQVPRQQSEAQLTFERVYGHLNESYHKARAEYHKAHAERKHALEENEYLREWIERTRATMPEARKRLRVLQRELREEVAECEEARAEFRLSSADRKRELETMATVERIVDKELTDADFLPVPEQKVPPPNATEPVPEKADPDLEVRSNNTDAASNKPAPKESLEDNVIYG